MPAGLIMTAKLSQLRPPATMSARHISERPSTISNFAVLYLACWSLVTQLYQKPSCADDCYMHRGLMGSSHHCAAYLSCSNADTRAWEVDTLRGHVNNVSCVMFHARQVSAFSATLCAYPAVPLRPYSANNKGVTISLSHTICPLWAEQKPSLVPLDLRPLGGHQFEGRVKGTG